MSWRRTGRRLVGAVCCGGAAAAPAMAAPVPVDGPAPALDVAGLVSDLGADSLKRRDAAYMTLERSVRLGEDQLVAHLRRDDLDMEQRMRLEACLRSRFVGSARAGMGVSFAPSEIVVVIGGLIDDFPAAEQGLLKMGDVFIEVGGEILDGESYALNAERVIRRIISHDPGDLVEIRIFRPDDAASTLAPGIVTLDGIPGEEIELLVPLGRFDDLPSPTQQRPERLEAAWAYRVARMGVEAWTPRRTPVRIGDRSWNELARAPGAVMSNPGLIAADPAVQRLTDGGVRRTQMDTRRAQLRRSRLDEEREQFEQFRSLLRGEQAETLLDLVDGDPGKQAAALEIIRELVAFREIREDQEEQLKGRRDDVRTRELIEGQLAGTDQKLAELRRRLIELVGDAPFLELREE